MANSTSFPQGKPLSKERAEELISEVDSNDRDGKLDYKEFIQLVWKEKWIFSAYLTQIRANFEKMDRDHSGSVDVEELKHYYENIAADDTIKTITEQIGKLDKDGDGKLSWEEFSAFFIDLYNNRKGH